jgi:hypothetical protein
LAVLRLTTSSNLVGRSIGKSASLLPLRIAAFEMLASMMGVSENCHPARRRHDFPQKLEPLAVELHRHERQACSIFAGPGEALSETRLYRVGAERGEALPE